MHQYDTIVWTLKLNYSRTRCQNFSEDQRSGRRLRQERLLLSLKQKFLKFFSWIRHVDWGWNRTCVPIDEPLYFDLTVNFDHELLSTRLTAPGSPRMTQPMKSCTTTPGSMPLTLYEQQCGFFYVRSHKNQNSERAVRRGLRFAVLIRED